MKVTVFTPTYNRAYIIENLYRSLQRQTCHDFEWLVVDDGSIDNTEALFGAWMQENNPFPIRYYRQENGGKHRAINRGLELAEGELFFTVDSDDYLTDDAVEWIADHIKKIPTDGRFAGICGIKADESGNDLGKSFCGEYLDCTSLQRTQYGIEGDKAEVFFTDILKRYPFPEFAHEKFITEAVVWDRIAADGYLLRFYNKIVYVAEYRQDGLTKRGLDLYYKNPLGYALYLNQARRLKKFPDNVQRYFDVEYYLNCRKTMSLQEISGRLGIPSAELLLWVAWNRMRGLASRIKRRIQSG